MISALRRFVSRVRAFLRPDPLDSDFSEELQSHHDMLVDDNIRRGMAPDDARRAAALRIGGTASLAEQHRARRGLPSVDTLLQDLRFAFRLMARDRWFSAAVILALGLGIGVNAIGFTVVNAAFLRGLPFEGSSQLLLLEWQPRTGFRLDLSHTELREWREANRAFTALAGFRNATINISDDRAMPEEARGTFVTANVFDVLRQPALIGRGFAAGDDLPGADPVTVISYRLWNNRFGRAPGVLGRTLRLNGRQAAIVGVMPDGMRFPNNTDIWAPLIPAASQGRRNAGIVTVFGRLNEGTSLRQAQAEVTAIGQQFSGAYPDIYKDIIGVHLETFTDRFIAGAARGVFIAMMGAVAFVLLIACTNVANMLLSRSAHRAREIAVRLAVGATRWRIVRQLLIESVVLGFMGGAIGFVIAYAGGEYLERAITDPEKPYWLVFTVDSVVFAYVAAICVLAAVVFGLAPALQISKTNMNDVLKEGGRGNPGGRRSLSYTMVVMQLALTVVLLAGAGLMIRSFMKLYTLDIGIRTDRLMAMRMRLPDSKYPTAESRLRFYEELAPRVEAIGGVESAAATTAVPPFGSGQRSVEIDGRAGDERALLISTVTISPTFFDVVGAPVRRGRAFTDQDGVPGSETVIVNERMAALYFPNDDPIGRRIRLREPEAGRQATPDSNESWRTIVGVSSSIRQGSLEEATSTPVIYIPYRANPPEVFSLLVRSSQTPASVMDDVRREVREIDQDQPVFTIQTLDEVVAENRWPYRVFGGFFTLFAAIGLVLSAIGLYGVTAYWVTQRTHEIGVRMALGADVRQVSWLVLKRGLMQMTLGLTLGVLGSLALTGIIRRALVQVSPSDPLTFAAITILLTMVSVVACLLPARRAARIDPLVALRTD